MFLDLEYGEIEELSSQRVDAVSRTLSGRILGDEAAGQRWYLALRLEPLAAFAMQDAALAQHRAEHGRTKAFELPMPQLVSATIASLATQLAVAAAPQADSVKLKSGADVTLPRGWFVSFAGHKKVYQVRERVTVTAAGVAVKLYPPPIEAVADDERWEPNPDLRCRYVSDPGFSSSRGIASQSIQVMEA